jgi:hypothetical protein
VQADATDNNTTSSATLLMPLSHCNSSATPGEPRQAAFRETASRRGSHGFGPAALSYATSPCTDGTSFAVPEHMRDRHRPSHFANPSIFVIVAAGAIPLSGCATVNSGDYGVALDDSGHPRSSAPSNERLQISAGERGSLSSPYFGVVEVTFENNTPAWIQIDHIDLDFGTPDKNKSVLIPWGEDIDIWEQATLQRNAIRRANTETVLGLVAIAGSVASAAGGHHAAGGIGGTVAVGALAGLYAQERADAVEATRDPSRFPPTHLLTLPLRVPPGLFTKRWLLLYTAAQPLGGCVDSFILSYETAEHEHGRVLLKFKGSYNYSSADGDGSEWQSRACAPPPSAPAMGP